MVCFLMLLWPAREHCDFLFANLWYMTIKWQLDVKIYTWKLLTFSISNFMTAYFNFYFSIRTKQKVAFISITLHGVFVNPSTKRLDDSSNETIKLLISLTVAYGVLSSIYSIAQSTGKMLNEIFCSTQSWINVTTGKLKPYAFNFAVRSSWFWQSNTLERSVSKAPNTLLLSTDPLHFSNKARRYC